MPRLRGVDVESATGKTRELLAAVQAELGMVPNLVRTMAHSPAVLEAYVGLTRALAAGRLPAESPAAVAGVTMRSDVMMTMLGRPEATAAIEAGPPRSDPDAGLLEILRGDRDHAAEALVARFGRRAYRLAVRITGNAHDAEEAAQDALWRVLTKIHTFRGESAFSSWVYRVTANSAYEARRRRHHARHEVSWDEALPRFDEEGHHAAPITDWSPVVDDPATQGELRAQLTRAIEQLPDDYRTVFVMRDVEGMSNADVAEALGMSVPAVKSRLHRARLVLREHLSRFWVTGHHPGTVAVREPARTGALPGARVLAAGVSRRPDAGASVAAAMSTAS